MEADPKTDDAWPCDWESHELQQLRRGATRSFRDKLIWLEEATAFAKKLQATSPHTKEISPVYGEGESKA
jgi:hypothetical protein